MEGADENGIRLASSMKQTVDEGNSKNERFFSILMDEEKHGSFQPYMPRIQQVPSMMEANKKCYNPSVVSIGPYHHGKPELEQMEKFKIPIAQKFIKDSCKPDHVFYNEFVKMAGYERPFYAEGSTTNFNDEDFARVMFLDGCFVLHFIYCFLANRLEDFIMMKLHQKVYAVNDLFLLENQIPFIVLKELMRMRFLRDHEGKQMIHNFIMMQATDASFLTVPKSRMHDDDEPLHLLQLLRTELLQNPNPNQEFGFLPHLEDLWSYRSVTELKTMGIKVKRSLTSHFKDVHFKAYTMHGELSLPPISIDESTKAKFLNLIAYENCPDTPDDNGIISYVFFMKALIANDHDVQELRSKGILQNFLVSDEQVVDLFRQLATGTVIDVRVYGSVKG